MTNLPEPKQGEVWDILLDPTVGREQGGRRPALVVSGDDFNQLPNGRHFIVPITSRNRGLVLHVPIISPEGGLEKDSVIMCDQIKSVSALRFKRRRGTVSPSTLDQVRELLRLIISQ